MVHVYLEQFGYFWKLPLPVWLGLCRRAAQGEGYQLDERYRLKRRPRCIVKWGDAFDNGLYAEPGVLFVQPLDWNPEEFKGWLDEHTGFDNKACEHIGADS